MLGHPTGKFAVGPDAPIDVKECCGLYGLSPVGRTAGSRQLASLPRRASTPSSWSARPLWRWILTATPSPPNLGLEDEGSNYFFFDYSTSTGQLFVSDAGADDYVGLDADQIYPVIVTAADRRGKWDKIEAGVYLDSATPAPSGGVTVLPGGVSQWTTDGRVDAGGAGGLL